MVAAVHEKTVSLLPLAQANPTFAYHIIFYGKMERGICKILQIFTKETTDFDPGFLYDSLTGDFQLCGRELTMYLFLHAKQLIAAKCHKPPW